MWCGVFLAQPYILADDDIMSIYKYVAFIRSKTT